MGVPGAAYAGPAVMTGLDWASIAPDAAWAFVSQSGSGGFVAGLTSLAPTAAPVDGLIGAVNRVAWSRNGAYALLYSSSAGQLQRIRLSAGGPVADPPIDLSPWGKASTLAIDPTGQRMAFGVHGAGLYLINAGQSPIAVSTATQPAPMAFDDTGLRLYAADLDQGQIVAFDSSGAPSPFASLARVDGSLLHPVGLAVSEAGRYLLLAEDTSRSVRVYDIASQSLANVLPLASAPSRLEPITSGPSFLLNGGDPMESLLILDGRQTPGVFFVPATREVRQ